MYDEAGQVLYEHDSEFDFSHSSEAVALTASDWEKVAEGTSSGKEPPIVEELLLNAEVFHQAHNYSMALVNAMIACEVYLYRLYLRKLVHEKLVGYVEASDIDNPSKIDRLEENNVLGSGDAERLRGINKMRNNVVHAKPNRTITPRDSVAAITAAKDLKALLIKLRK